MHPTPHTEPRHVPATPTTHRKRDTGRARVTHRRKLREPLAFLRVDREAHNLAGVRVKAQRWSSFVRAGGGVSGGGNPSAPPSASSNARFVGAFTTAWNAPRSTA
jgi:hypothetical protein